MKANNGTGNTPERDDWRTPRDLFNELNKHYSFTFDCCADANNHLCAKWSSDFANERVDMSQHVCWMNPPFSKAHEMFDVFIQKELCGVCIYRCDNLETALWQKILKHASWVYFIEGRVNYEGKVGKGSRFPSALIGFNVQIPYLQIRGSLVTTALLNFRIVDMVETKVRSLINVPGRTFVHVNDIKALFSDCIMLEEQK